jgi:phosphate/sulfate permease
MEFLAGLPVVRSAVLAVIFVVIVFQEAVNGFHDTANAVATVLGAETLSHSATVMKCHD